MPTPVLNQTVLSMYPLVISGLVSLLRRNGALCCGNGPGSLALPRSVASPARVN